MARQAQEEERRQADEQRRRSDPGSIGPAVGSSEHNALIAEERRRRMERQSALENVGDAIYDFLERIFIPGGALDGTVMVVGGMVPGNAPVLEPTPGERSPQDIDVNPSQGQPVAPRPATGVGQLVAGKAPNQVQPGIRVLEGQYVNDLGQVQPWRAHYDQFGRLIARTDFNAGNAAAGIPDVHHHTYQWGPGMNPLETGSHIPGEYVP